MDIERLKRMANNKSNWRERLQAVEGLAVMDDQPSKDILARLAIHDPVFKVKEAAFRAAQARKITYAGKPIYLGKKPKGNLVKEINKKLVIVRDKLEEGFTLEDFKRKFSEMYPEIYDTYEGDKGDQLDKWLSNVIPSLPKKK
ncbi:MAG: HEAT repeat domain-containing protein [Selenomonadales bacterium]|nr:HEAT repeat domain-containing protein [Selenomonadales bacterium]